MKDDVKKMIQDISAMSASERERLAESHSVIITCNGHVISTFNMCLIASQCRAMSTVWPAVVGGFKQWQRHGRKVKKGEHGFVIYVPSTKQVQTVNVIGQREVDENETTKIKFYTAYVFDISQTEHVSTT